MISIPTLTTSRSPRQKDAHTNASIVPPVFSHRAIIQRDPLEVADEIEYWTNRHGVDNIAFYDDALLIDSKDHIAQNPQGSGQKKDQLPFPCP